MLVAMPHIARLTPEQFKALAKYKGWKYTMLAKRWELTAVWISNMARDPNRPARFDDMLMGLPNLNKLKRDLAGRQKQLDAALARITPPVAAPPQVPRLQPGFRYHGYLTLGMIVTASVDVGSIAEEGMRGIVFEVQNRGHEEVYGVIFENGLWDWFSPDYVDMYLASTGLIPPGVDDYRYRDEVHLQHDYATGIFTFWPPG